MNWIKINFDGSAKDIDGKAGCGVIARNHEGIFLASAYMDCGKVIALEAEIQGFLLAVRMANKYGWRKVWFEGDSLTIVQAAWQKKESLVWRRSGWWNLRLARISCMEYMISHTYREGNRVADKLANLGVRAGCIKWQTSVLEEISIPLEEDRCNFSIFRLL